jgi:hypothetical protein
VATVQPSWNPPAWSDHGGKHFPNPNLPWERIVKGTGGKRGFAKYHPRLTRAMVERLELDTLDEEGHEIIPHPKPNTRMFWREIRELGFAVGASAGQETSYIYVEYNSSGTVHGRPITWDELKLKDPNL